MQFSIRFICVICGKNSYPSKQPNRKLGASFETTVGFININFSKTSENLMRRTDNFIRIGLVCLLCLIFSFNSAAQSEKAVEDFAEKDSEIQFQPAFFSVTRRNFSIQKNSPFSNFSNRNLPLIFNNSFSKYKRKGIQTLLSTATGITQLNDNQMSARFGLISSNGQRATSNEMNYNLGLAADETSFSRNAGALPTLTASGGYNSLVPISATQEISVKTMSSAKEQRTSGSQIGFVSRSGTNQFHGSLFETFGNESLNANDFFANEKGFGRAPNRLNLFGGTFGGFFVRDKAFFFTNFEGLRLNQAAFGRSEVPDFLSRQNAAPEIRPLFNAFPIANGQNTSNGLAEFSANFTNPTENNIFGLRINFQPNYKFSLAANYNLSDSSATFRGNQDFSLNTLRRLDVRTDSLSVQPTFVATSTVVINGGISFSRNRLEQKFSLDDFGGANVSNSLLSLPFDFLKYDLNGKNSALALGNPIQTDFNLFQTGGAVDWIAGRHQLTFGGNYRKFSLDILPSLTERNVLFSGVSLNETASRINEMTRIAAQMPNLSNFSLYGNENWRITSRLTANFGARWDADFAPQFNAPSFTFQNATPQMPENSNNFAPRAGFAWNIFGNAVIRGGAGLYFDYGNSAASEIFANSFPFSNGNFARNTNFMATPANSLTPLLVFAENLKTPRALHIYGEYQQEIFSNHTITATYNASFGQNLFLTRTFFDANPTYNFIRLTDNSAESNFQSLQLRFERRFSRGFSFNARYALTKSTDNFSPDLIRESSFLSTDLELEKGASDFDVRHQISVYGIYDIPTLFDGGWKKFLTKNWSLSAFANARSGFPVNITYARTNNFGKEFFRPDLISNVPIYQTENGIKRLNPNAFSIPNELRQGNFSRNSLRGFSLFQLDTSLQKRIKFTNEVGLNLSINTYNLLNNTNLADANGNLGTIFSNGNFQPNSYFGRAVETYGNGSFTPFYLYGGARTIQFTAKFVF